MVSTLTIGGIWKNRKTEKEYELVAINKETNHVQLAALRNGEGYNCMTEKSMRKNYTLTAFKTEEHKPTPILVEDGYAYAKGEGLEDELGELKTEPVKQEAKRAPAGRIELPDGKVIPGIRFLLDIAKKTEAETCKDGSVIFWLINIKEGKELLEAFSAKVVYGKPLNK